METFKHRDREFVVFKLPYTHYEQIHLYYSGKYIPKFGTSADVEYLSKNRNTGILVLEEGEVDSFQRSPLIKELIKYRNNNNLQNQIYILYQGSGQESYIKSFLRTIPPYITFIQSNSAIYNFVMNWTTVERDGLSGSIDDPPKVVKKYYNYEDYLTNIELKKKFLIFGGKTRAHRLMFLDKFLENGLDVDSYYTFNNQYLKIDKKLIERLQKEGYGYRQILENHNGKSEIDFLNSKGILLSKSEVNRIRKIRKKLPLFNLPRKTDDYYYDDWWIFPEPSLYKSSFVDIVLETFHGRGILKDDIFSKINFHTEKINKPVLACRPFMVLSNKNYLRDLRKIYGYKTFSDYWDESYDDVDDVRKANKIVIDNMKYLQNKSISELEEMLYNMKDILIHNNKISKEYLLGGPVWKRVITNYVDGMGLSWNGTYGINNFI
jgi:hypothetical protein